MKSFNEHRRQLWPLALAIAFVLSFFAAAAPAWSDYAEMRDEVAQFHAFMQEHPKVSTELQSNPQLVNDRKYLDKHEEVRKFLRQHPAVQQEIANHPRRVFGRYYIDDRREYSDNRPEHRWDYRYHEQRLVSARSASSDYEQIRAEVAQFHAFMQKHPKVSTDLQSNPQLVNDRKYLDKHEEVRKFLRQHPAVQQEIAQHPRRVFGRYYIDDRRVYSDNRPEHRWDYRYHERRYGRDDRDYRDRR